MDMHATRRRPHYALYSLAAATVLLVVAVPAIAQGPGPLGVEHFYAYSLRTQFFGGFSVTLTDQFQQSEHDVEYLEWFALPVEKNGEGIVDFITHYTWWRLARNLDNPVTEVTVNNQYGNQLLLVGDAAYLLNPATKNGSPSTGIPKGQVVPNDVSQTEPDHYKCYSVQGDPIGLSPALSHQFGTETPLVLQPVYLCNPVEKVLPGGTVYPIRNANAHLVCYLVENGVPLGGQDVIAADQFIAASLLLESPQLFCVPSEKQIPVQPEEGTWGRVKSIYR